VGVVVFKKIRPLDIYDNDYHQINTFRPRNINFSVHIALSSNRTAVQKLDSKESSSDLEKNMNRRNLMP